MGDASMVNLWLDFLYKVMIGGDRTLLEQVASQLKGCDLNFVAPSGGQENALSRRLMSGRIFSAAMMMPVRRCCGRMRGWELR